MRFSVTAALLSLASSVLAQTPGFDVISKPTKGEVIPAGTTYVIDWEPSTNWTGSVTIDLLGGPDQGGLQPLSVIAKGVDSNSGEYSWNVDEDLGTLATYGIRITLDSDNTVFQYSFPFSIKAAAGTSTSSESGSASTTATPSTTTTATATDDDSDSETTVTTVTTSSSKVTSAPTGGNLSTTGSPSKTRTTATTGTGATSSPTGSTVPGSPGSVVRASSLALFAGFALAIFAL